MICCEGYKAFYGSALITPRNDTIQPFRISGDWLFKPDTGCWYVEGRSFPARLVSDIHDRTSIADEE